MTPGPFEFSFLRMSSMSGGKTKANVVEHKAPMSDMNNPRFGTNSAIKTVEKCFNEKACSMNRILTS